ncbi:DMT family transporter [Hellea balneolensis]|uniref:DMT family transporter n=1 Tax=Hellea balneolensis TaxID=287478 RepID=UPI00041F6A10|nr:DMT family transporter [Hellea balneolensis]
MKTNLREVTTAPLMGEAQSSGFGGRNLGYLLALIGTVFFSMKSIFVKLIYQPVDGMAINSVEAITIMAMRLGFSTPIYGLILWLALRRRRQQGLPPLLKRDMALAACLGLLGYYICAWLDIEGIKYITAQLERLLLFTYPIFVFIFGAMFFGKPLTKQAVFAVFIAYAGIGLIFAGGDIAVGLNVPLGSAMVLLCAACFAFFQLFAKPMIGRLTSPVFTCCAMLGAGVMIAVHFTLENVVLGDVSEVLNLPPRIWLLGIALAFFSTLLPSFMVNLAISRVGPQATSAVGMIAPVSTIFLAIYVLGEPFASIDGVGTLITVSGIALYTYFDRRAISSPLKSNLSTDK